MRIALAAPLFLLAIGLSAYSPRDGRQKEMKDPGDTLAYGRLIPTSATMQRAWEIPANPLTDSIPGDRATQEEIRLGFRIFTMTKTAAPQYAANDLSCSNCHLNGGQHERALPLVGIAAMYPEFNKRAGRPFTIEDRIIECFKRSMDASRSSSSAPPPSDTLGKESPVVAAVASYLNWLGRGFQNTKSLPWRGKNVIASANILPLGRLDTARGRALFQERCTNCHGENGQGVEIGDKKAGPLWGANSWNDGAGTARIYTLAGFIRYAMPYLDPGSLTDEEAQHIAAFINAQERPVYPLKAQDYPGSGPPSDAVYYFRGQSEK